MSKIIVICNTACALNGGKYYCQLPTSISNAKRVRVVDASVSFSSPYNDIVIICSDNLLVSGPGDLIRRGPIASETIATNVLTTCRPLTTVANDRVFDVGSSAIYSELAPAAVDVIDILFLSPAMATLAPTTFCLIFEFVF